MDEGCGPCLMCFFVADKKVLCGALLVLVVIGVGLGVGLSVGGEEKVDTSSLFKFMFNCKTCFVIELVVYFYEK